MLHQKPLEARVVDDSRRTGGLSTAALGVNVSGQEFRLSYDRLIRWDTVIEARAEACNWGVKD